MNVTAIDATCTHDLRRRVLRDGDADASVVWAGDDHDDTVHLGIRLDGMVVAISTWLTDGVDCQLRGMATEPARRGDGLGALVLLAGLERARHRGVRQVWANARVGAIGFYEHHGFVVSGPVFPTTETGLPHRRVTFEFR